MKTKHKRYTDFAWQNGYGAFSVGQSQLDDLRGYVANQRNHHRHTTFQDEFREICKRYDVNLDERYAWE